MRNTIERMIVPRDAAAGSLEYKDRFALFAPVAGTNKIGMAKFSSKEFDVKDQTVSLRPTFAETISRKVDITEPLPDNIVFTADGYKTPGVLYNNCQYEVAVDFVDNEYVYESKIGSLFVTETLIKDVHILTEVFFADGHIWLRELTIQGEFVEHTEFLQADEDFHPYIANLQGVVEQLNNTTVKKFKDRSNIPKAYTYEYPNGDSSKNIGVKGFRNPGSIVTYAEDDTDNNANASIPVATPIYDGHAANKGYVDLNDVTDFTIEPAKDLEDNVVFGVYNFKVTLGSGKVLAHQLDLPFEAVQLASVDDYIGDDGKRYLEIRFVDESITPLNIELDEIFNFDVFSKQFIEKLESEYDEQVYLQDAEGNVTLHKVDYTASANSIVRRNSSRDILLKPTVSNDLAAVSKGQMEAYANNAVKPYDVATQRVDLNYNAAFLKLTIANLLDGNYASFQPFDLVCVGSDGMPMSSICTMFVEQYDHVRMLVYDSKHNQPYPLYPQYYTSEEGNVYLYFDTYGEYLQVFIRGLVEKCTGATLEIVDALPDSILDIDVERHLTESALGNIEEALDSIISLQESYMGVPTTQIDAIIETQNSYIGGANNGNNR